MYKSSEISQNGAEWIDEGIPYIFYEQKFNKTECVAFAKIISLNDAWQRNSLALHLIFFFHNLNKGVFTKVSWWRDRFYVRINLPFLNDEKLYFFSKKGRFFLFSNEPYQEMTLLSCSYLVMWGHLKCISLMSYCCRCWSDHSA